MWKKIREVGTCLSVEELSALYDRAIRGNAADRLRDHLARCPKCAGEFKVLSRLMNGVQARAVPRDLLRRATQGSTPWAPPPPRRRTPPPLSLR